jgi:multidrug resistance efflux pump
VRKALLIVVVLAAVALGIGWALARARAPRSLVLSGSVEARDAEVGSLVGGRVLEVHVDEGAAVTAGQPLVALEPDLIDRQLTEQMARVAEARAALARVESGPRREQVRRARIEAEAAETDRKRLEPLLAAGAIGQREYDAAVVKAATTREAHEELERGSRSEDLDAARAAVSREEGRLAYLERQREEMVIRAPVAGVVEVVDLRPGDIVPPNQPVATILEPDQLWVRVYVPEPQLGFVRKGMAAEVTVDTFPGRVFPGRVVEIRGEAEYTPRNIQTLDQRADQVFGVKIDIDRAPELKPGMAAFVRLVP